ncbi:Clp protease N-terminal domain-containing protein [Staphylococcus aureus]
MDEARKLHHNFVGTEHILLGLFVKRRCCSKSFCKFRFKISTKTREQVVKASGV